MKPILAKDGIVRRIKPYIIAKTCQSKQVFRVVLKTIDELLIFIDVGGTQFEQLRTPRRVFG